MDRLNDIKKFDEYHSINEDLIHGEQNACNRAFLNGGLIEFKDGSSVTPREIVNAVNDALSYLNSEYSRTFKFAKETLNIIYLAHSNKYKTMAVDKYMNLYLNAGFVYSTLKMDKILIAAVIMHEVFHALFNHIERGTNWLSSKGKSKNAQTWHDTNLAADVEVNRMLVKVGLIEAERLVNEIRGLYLETKSGNRDVVPMEVILNDEDYMNKLRSMCPPPADPEQGQEEVIETTEEWDKGYKDAVTKISELINKYGYEKVWEMLKDEGIINGVGEILNKDYIDNVKSMEFLQVKSYEDFINESTSGNKGQTYEEGFATAFGSIIDALNDAINGHDDDDDDDDDNDGKQPDGPKFKTKLKDLPQINLPLHKRKEKSGGSNGLPPVVQNTNKEDSQTDDNKDNSDNNSNGSGNDTKKTVTKQNIEFDNSNDSRGSSNSNENEDDNTSIGGMGSFQEEGLTDDELRDSGYSDDDIKNINDIRNINKGKNTKAKFDKIIDAIKREERHTSIGKMLDAIEVESEKYRNVWRKIMDQFLSKRTRRAGQDTPTGSNDWMNKRHIARGEYAIHRRREAQDPQDVNIYVDVSGSMDWELLKIICKSLVIYTQEYEYSGINVCPWASHSNGVHPVTDFYDKDEKEVSSEIIDIIKDGENSCGGGTESSAVLRAMIEAVKETLANEDKEQKDDVHVVITDGYFDYEGIEDNMMSAIRQYTNRNDVAELAPKHTFWMIYESNNWSMPSEDKNKWRNEIKKGTLIFINSDVVKNNG